MTGEKKIVLGVTGSIAAYKAVDLLRAMTGRGWDVTVVMTRAAKEFVGELTFRTLSRHPVNEDMFGETVGWIPEHISLADRADLLVVAPCTASMMAKLALGLADDLLSCTALACRAPLVIAPAMNEAMWDHPATRANVERLQARGAHIIDVGEGDLACGREGRGRMAPVEAVVSAVAEQLKENKA